MNKFIVAFYLYSFLFVSANAQNKTSIIASVKYNVLNMQGTNLVIKDICELDISKSESYYYSLGELENFKKIKEQYDQAMATGSILKRSSRDRLHNLCPFKIFKNYETKKAYSIQYIDGQNIGFIVDTLNATHWKITNEVRKIGNLNCRKAETKKDSVSITAWFCQDIPINDGPNMYFGLPGLVVEATTTSGYSIKLISVSYNKDPKLLIKVPSFIAVTKAQVDRALKNENAAFKRGQMPGGIEAKMVPNGN